MTKVILFLWVAANRVGQTSRAVMTPRLTLDGAIELHNWAALAQKLHIHRCFILHR